MTKQQLIKKIQESLTEASRRHVPWVIEGFMRQVKAEVAKGNRIDLRGFGSFAPAVRKAKVGRAGAGLTTPTIIPAKTVVKFKPSDAFFEAPKGAAGNPKADARDEGFVNRGPDQAGYGWSS